MPTSSSDCSAQQSLSLAFPDGAYDATPTAPFVLMVRDSAGGVVQASAEQVIKAASMVLESQLKGDKIDLSRPNLVKTYVRTKLFGLGHEVCIGLFLDAQLRLIECVQVARGTLTSASVYPREIVKEALRLNAASLILAHNHPSGASEPSAADISLTRQLKSALALVDVRLLDHLVAGEQDAVSLAERGQV